MIIYTSYFAMIHNFPENIIPIAICAKPPAWYNGLVYKKLAPTYNILMDYKSNQDIELYKQRFQKDVINHLNYKSVIEDLESLANGKDIALICFEKSTDFCHRHLIANWLKENNYNVEEFKKGSD